MYARPRTGTEDAMRWLCQPLLILLACSIAWAEINVSESLDWLVVSHPHVALVGPAGVEALKGTLGPSSGGPERLVFLDAGGRVARTIDLAAPSPRGDGVAITTSFDVLTTREAILEVVRRRLQRPATPDAEPTCLRVEVPEDSPAFGALWSGSACYLIVPADPELLPERLRATSSPEPWVRARAAWRLAAYTGGEAVAALRRLLDYEGTARLMGSGRDVEVYPARQTAWFALRAIGVEAARPAGWSDALLPWSFD